MINAEGSSLEEIEEQVLRIVKNEKRLDDTFTRITKFEEIGLDSLALVRILVSIDQTIGVWLEGDALSLENLTDVQSLSQYIKNKIL